MDLAKEKSIKKHTNKDFKTWVQLLNKRGGKLLSHQQLVSILKSEFKLRPWWQQEVARAYHVEIGVRLPNQTLKGNYTTTATKSFTSSARELFNFLISNEGQALWLKPLYPVIVESRKNFEIEGQIFGEFRTVTKNQKLRITWINEDWEKKSTVLISLYPKVKTKKCLLAINHTELPTRRAKTEMHSYWRAALDSISEAID